MIHFRNVICLLLVAAAIIWWRLGAVGLIDPDEPFYAETAREMVATNDWITPQIFGKPQFEKPIAFYWLAAGSFKIFGENEFAARAPSAFFGTALVLLAYAWGARVWNRRAGLIAGLALCSGLEFGVMSRLMLTDIALSFFIALSLFSYWLALERTKRGQRADFWLVAHFVCVGIAVLLKGPVASLICALATAAFLIRMKRPFPFRGAGLWLGAALYALIAIPWFAVMLWKFGWEYFNAFFIHENVMRLIRAEHPTNNHFYYYIGILVLGSLPWIPLLGLTLRRAFSRKKNRSATETIAALERKSGEPHESRKDEIPSDEPRDEAAIFLWCWIATSFVFLTIAQSKLPSYIFFLFLPLALLIGKNADDILARGFRTKGEWRLVFALCFLQGIIAALCPLFKVAHPFAQPAVLVSICLGVALVMFALGFLRTWIALHVAATVALIFSALTWSRDTVETMSSVRDLARAVMENRRDNEPILTDKFLARGIFFYTHEPVSVLATKPQPFWTAHPLPVVVGEDGLKKVLRENGSALCALRNAEWPNWRKYGFFNSSEPAQHFGTSILARARMSGETAAKQQQSEKE